jgi:serine/threonine protein kinase/type II secretory pathway pseudopilin PulG
MTTPSSSSEPAPPSSAATAGGARVSPYPTDQFARVVAAVGEIKHPERIGPYHILELIGEGGMGTVYKAEQRQPIHRVVAIKIIKLGMDTRQVIARFESERQALALMDHPNVARVLDAGATEAGRPYFVMEYVRGEPITAFADRHKLTVRQRLELFMQACDAVQHAHQKAIIHRDLKPTNILVTLLDDKPTVKVIDFGVAKALSQRLTERTLFTETGQLVGTPEYMAPEQADSQGLDVDTRSDVYSLGVVLYELLSGALPFDATSLRSAGFQEIQRIIREVDPPRPSTRLSGLGDVDAQTVAQRRQVHLEVLSKELKSELEWIPLKAMRKDRAQRYATATELSDDISNYLTQRPLRAGPESTWYRARKFLRRNKGTVATGVLVVAVLLAGVATTSWQAIRARRAERQAVAQKNEAQLQRQRAEDASQNVREVNHFLTDDLLASASPEITRGREMTVREALDRAAQTVPDRFKGRPITEAAVRAVVADTYSALGRTDVGLPHAQATLDILNRQLGPDDEQTLTAAHEVGRELSILHKDVEAEKILRDVLARSRRILGENHPVTLTCMNSLGQALRQQERYAEAEPIYRDVLERDRRVHGPQSLEYAKSLNSLAVLLNTQHRTAEAEPLYRESLAIKEKLLGKDHPTYLSSLANLARVLEDQNKLAEAEAMDRQALQDKRRVLGDDHPSTTLTMNDLGYVLFEEGKLDESEALYREALTHRRKALGNDDIDTLQSVNNLGKLLLARANYAEAEPLMREAMEKRRVVLGATHPYTIGSTAGLAQVFERQEHFAEAEPLLAKVCSPELLSQMAPPQQAVLVARYGICLERLDKLDLAEPRLRDALTRLRTTPQETNDPERRVLTALAKLCDRTNRAEEAAKLRSEVAALPPPTTRPTSGPATSPG